MPLYIQLESLLRESIARGELPPGTQLPGEAELGRQVGLSRLTVRRALENLQREGLIRTERGRGSFVNRSQSPPGSGISLIMSQLHHVFHVDLIRGIEGEIKRAGYHLVTRITRNDPDEERRDIEAALADQNAAILLFPAVGFKNREIIQAAVDRAVPVTFIDRWYPGITADVVTADNVRGGYLATSHLIELGHRRIGFLSSKEHETTAVEERLLGYRQALVEAGIPYDTSLVTILADTDDTQLRNDAIATIARLTRKPNGVTAFVSCHDRAALAALHLLNTLGIKVPADVALTGFNDYPWAATMDVPLTTIAPQPWDELGATAARLTLERLERQGGEPRRILLPVRLVVRASTVGEGAVAFPEPVGTDVTRSE